MIGPAAELEVAALAIEREVSDVNFAGGPELGGRWPKYGPVEIYHRP